MCTSIALFQGAGYFGRNLDLDCNFGRTGGGHAAAFPAAVPPPAGHDRALRADRHGQPG